MTHRRTVTVTLLALSLAAGTAAFGQQPAKGKPEKGQPAASAAVPGFSASERRIIADYFARNRIAVKPLPPGIARNLARGKPLPPGIAKQRIPAGLATRLPPRGGVEITIFGDRVVLLEASGLVVDILADVLH